MEKQLYKIISPKEKHWVGNGFYVSTLFSVHSEDYHYITPFILLDHASPKTFLATDKKLGVGEHPHRGFETVTFAIQGAIDHRDSGGGGGTIHTGGVQWMTAGSGLVHEEFHSRQFAAEGGVFEMVQLWVNLKAQDKMTKPRYQSMNLEDFNIECLNDDSLKIKVIAGHYQNTNGSAKTFSPMNIYEVFTEKTQRVPLTFENNSNTLLIQLKGTSKINDQSLNQGQVAVFEREGESITYESEAGSHVLVLNGEPIDEPVAAYGPFVMNTKAEIHEAINDFEAGRMGQLVEEA